jgi:hypothetical protein
VKRGDLDLAKWLLEQGVDPEPVGYSWRREGQTPLAVAKQSGEVALAKVLVEAGARR